MTITDMKVSVCQWHGECLRGTMQVKLSYRPTIRRSHDAHQYYQRALLTREHLVRPFCTWLGTKNQRVQHVLRYAPTSFYRFTILLYLFRDPLTFYISLQSIHQCFTVQPSIVLQTPSLCYLETLIVSKYQYSYCTYQSSLTAQVFHIILDPAK